METLVVCICAFFTALITLFSGFGLGTILMPIFALFFPVNLAISLTAVIHLFNSLFRGTLLIRSINKKIVALLALPSIVGAILGAFLLIKISSLKYFIEYSVFNHDFKTTPVKLVIGLLILVYLVLELTHLLDRVKIQPKQLKLGGLVAGFFGGFSGHQGIFRSMILLQTDLSSEEYVATNLIIAVMIDIARLTVYGAGFSLPIFEQQTKILTLASLSAMGGSLIGILFIKKITVNFVRVVVSVLLSIIALGLITGIV